MLLVFGTKVVEWTEQEFFVEELELPGEERWFGALVLLDEQFVRRVQTESRQMSLSFCREGLHLDQYMVVKVLFLIQGLEVLQQMVVVKGLVSCKQQILVAHPLLEIYYLLIYRKSAANDWFHRQHLRLAVQELFVANNRRSFHLL